MKKDIHPKYTPLKVKIGGEVFHTRSTYEGDEYYMDVDFRKHRAWTGEGNVSANEANKKVSEFNKKFSGLSFGMSKNK